ncbi:MAG: hypothetical protein ACT4PT_13190, partial [Methanobacteriota archaeon]
PAQGDDDEDGVGDACDDTDGSFPTPDGDIRGGITIFSDLDPALAHNEAAAIGTGLAGDPKPKFVGREPVTFRSRFSTAPTGVVTPGTTGFTWYLWNADGDIVRTFGCRARNDSSGFDCPGKTTLPSEPGIYYASARLNTSEEWITDTPSKSPEHVGLKGLEILPAALPPPLLQTVTFEDDGEPANTFFTQDSTFGQRTDTNEIFTLAVTQGSDVTIRLEWSSTVGFDDLDLYVTGAATDKSTQGFTDFEEVSFENVSAGNLTIRVDPYQINDAVFGTHYTLVAVITNDADDDGVPDGSDDCPGTPAGTPVDDDGCPTGSGERVVIRVDGVAVANETVDGNGGDTFDQLVDLTGKAGAVEVEVSWYDEEWLVATETITLNAT